MSTKIRIDPSLVVSWSMSLSKAEPYEYPFEAHYKTGNKRLVYIASLHACESDSATFQMIHQTFENEKIDLVILEGIRHSAGPSPEKIIEWASYQGKDGFYEGFETAFAVTLAHRKNIPFVGGEPDDTFVLAQITNDGFSAEDLLFYYFVQQVFQFRESQRSPEVGWAEFFSSFIQRRVETLELEEPPTYSDFKSWYLKQNGRSFVPSEIHSEVPAPFEDGELFTQRVSSAVCKIRDRFLVTRIDLALKT